jgi:hypothetical protein
VIDNILFSIEVESEEPPWMPWNREQLVKL